MKITILNDEDIPENHKRCSRCSRCSRCHGDGGYWGLLGDPERCSQCQGQGQGFIRKEHMQESEVKEVENECPICDEGPDCPGEHTLIDVARAEVYILNVTSESGDEYGPFVFLDKPADNEELFKFLQEKTNTCDCEEYRPEEDGCPGWMGTYLHLKWTKTNIN